MREKDKKIAHLEDELDKARLTIATYKKVLFEKHKNTEMGEEQQQQERTAGVPDKKNKKESAENMT